MDLPTQEEITGPENVPMPTGVTLDSLADAISQLTQLVAEVQVAQQETNTTLATIASTLQQFSEVNPQELIGLLGKMM